MGLLRNPRLGRLLFPLALLLFLLYILTFILPYDNSFVLFYRWHTHNVVATLRPPSRNFDNSSLWYPTEMDDVGMIIKTGFATRDRLAARLDTFDQSKDAESVVIIADYASPDARRNREKGSPQPVYDVLASLLVYESKNSSRIEQYKKLASAIKNGVKDVPRGVSGWELDIMKHIPGLELGYKMMPGRHWYIMSDDDTYIIDESLLAVLEQFDPFEPHYLGNAIGDYKGRFAHGGSSIILSQAAMQKLFVQQPEIVQWAREESLTATLGDKVIAQAFLKVGVYLDELYGMHFNGESPRQTKIRSDRFCDAIATFHHLTPPEMIEMHEIIGELSHPLYWVDVWSIFAQGQKIETLPQAYEFPKIQTNWDYVGYVDESVMQTKDVHTAGACLDICEEQEIDCMAWIWKDGNCFASPWLIVGQETKGVSSGINVEMAGKLALCP